MVANGSQAYDHDRDGTHTQLGGEDKGCEAKFRNKDYETQVADSPPPLLIPVPRNSGPLPDLGALRGRHGPGLHGHP